MLHTVKVTPSIVQFHKFWQIVFSSVNQHPNQDIGSTIAKRWKQPMCFFFFLYLFSIGGQLQYYAGFCHISIWISHQFSSAHSLSRVRLFATPWITARQASLSITISQSSLRLKSIESVMPSSHLILCHPLLLLPSIPPSIKVFFNESTLRMRWSRYWSFSFSISPSKKIPGLISFRMDWLDLLAVQGTLKSLL